MSRGFDIPREKQQVGWAYLPNKNFPFLGSFYPFFILAKVQILSEFEHNMRDCFRKKDNFKDKKADCRQSAECFCVAKHADTFNADNQARIKRIIFLKNREAGKIQTTPKLSPHYLFQIYPSDYNLQHLIRETQKYC